MHYLEQPRHNLDVHRWTDKEDELSAFRPRSRESHVPPLTTDPRTLAAQPLRLHGVATLPASERRLGCGLGSWAWESMGPAVFKAGQEGQAWQGPGQDVWKVEYTESHCPVLRGPDYSAHWFLPSRKKRHCWQISWLIQRSWKTGFLNLYLEAFDLSCFRK